MTKKEDIELQSDIRLGPVLGHEDQKGHLKLALDRKQLHHGWLFTGPRGIGKTRLALQFASAVLNGSSDLDLSQDNTISNLIASGGHPDVRVVQRPFDEKGKRKTEIPVESARSIGRFFSLKPALGGWRIVIVDSVDELNAFGSNALLKTLEEPPKNALLILISHGEVPVLPTIKSRCRRLSFKTLSESDALTVLTSDGTGLDEAAEINQMSPGRPGQALSFNDPQARAAGRAAFSSVKGKGVSPKTLSTVMNAASKSEMALSAAFRTWIDLAEKSARSSDQAIEAGIWADLRSDLVNLYRETIGLNQDKSQAAANAVLLFQKTRHML